MRARFSRQNNHKFHWPMERIYGYKRRAATFCLEFVYTIKTEEMFLLDFVYSVKNT